MKISTKRQCTYSKSSKTLDTRHKEQIEIFEDNKQTIDLLLTKFHEVNKKLEFLKSKEKKYMTDKELSDIPNRRASCCISSKGWLSSSLKTT